MFANSAFELASRPLTRRAELIHMDDPSIRRATLSPLTRGEGENATSDSDESPSAYVLE